MSKKAFLVVKDGEERHFATGGDLAALAGIDLETRTGCFTTGRVAESALLWQSQHLARLASDAKQLGCSDHAVTSAMTKLVTATERHLDGLGRATLRWGLFTQPGRKALSWVTTLEPERRQPWQPGHRALRFSLSPAPPARVLFKAMDRRAFRRLEKGVQPGHDGVVMFRSGGEQRPPELLEGTWFNLFALIAGRWQTPVGVLAGLTRQRMLELLSEEGCTLVSGLDPESLADAEAVVATSSLLGFAMVDEIGGYPCGRTSAGSDAVDRLRSKLWTSCSTSGTRA